MASVSILAFHVLVAQSDEDSLRQKAKSMARDYLILDGHIDMPYRLHNQGKKNSDQYLPEVLIATKGEFDYQKARKGGLDVAFMAVFVPAKYQETGGGSEYADELINMIDSIILAYPDKFAACGSSASAKANFKQGLISLSLGLENGAPIVDFDALRHFYQRGIRYITLTHGKDNHICDSSYDDKRTWGGLSDFGKSLIPEMNKTGMLIDVSHVSDQTFYQVLDLTATPVLATHSSCRKFTPGWERNMSDEMIEKLAENGGVIQINFGSDFIDGTHGEKKRDRKERFDAILESKGLEKGTDEAKALWEEFRKVYPKPFASVDQVADHIDHVVSLVGINHVGLGSDFDGVGDSLPTGLKDPSDFPNLIYTLLKRGYSDQDIEKLCGLNVLRVWEEVENYASQSGN